MGQGGGGRGEEGSGDWRVLRVVVEDELGVLRVRSDLSSLPPRIRD